ncbi:MAG: amidohydrolase [Myxococcota bacterium]
MQVSNMRMSMAVIAMTLGCGGAMSSSGDPEEPEPEAPPLPWARADVRYQVSSPRTALSGATILTGAGAPIEDGVIVFENGRIVAVGDRSVELPAGTDEIDVSGKVITPGIIDTHSHMGVYARPSIAAHWDGNEATDPVTAQVWAGDSFWPQDPALTRALAGGVTTILVLPGSANLIGGRGAILKLHLGRTVSDMLFPNAPDTLKMACGENPKRVYGERLNSFPSTRMGSIAGIRGAFQEAQEYLRSYRDWQHEHRLWQGKRARFEAAEANEAEEGDDEAEDPGPAPSPPDRDFGLEALVGAMEGRVLVQMHCYRADEMLRMLEVADEFGFRIRAFHHAVEAYKIRDVLAERQVGVSTWADWWGFKLEAFDAIEENLALLEEAGVMAVMHSDSPELIQRLNQEAAKAMTSGQRAGVSVGEDAALRWITRNAAWTLGIDEQTGTLEAGKMADVVVWSQDPFSVYAHAERVYIDGLLAHHRDEPVSSTDFEVGQGADARSLSDEVAR